ncbi:hypothetical protein BH10BAC2_BH10BAC2_26680 [soil metagenome]
MLYAADCQSATSDDCNQDISSLVYDVYYPDKTIEEYEACPLPAVILFHAGGFSECSNYGQPGISTICEELAKRGYVAFCVEYRRGRVKQGNKYTTVQQQLAVYRACQDARGAIRSIIKRQNNETSGDAWGDEYRININKIFIGGMSAGGVAAMNTAWYTNTMVYEIFQSVTTPSGATINQALGSIDLNAYYGDPSISYKANIIGTTSMWSAISIPSEYDLDPAKEEYDFFADSSEYLKPHLGFAGRLDETFPYYDDNDKQYVYFHPDTSPAVNSTSYCIRSTQGSYQLDPTASTPDLINGSCLNMYKILNHFGVKSELYLDCQMKHGLDVKCVACPSIPTGGANYYVNNTTQACTACVFASDFGTGFTDPTLVYKYIAQRIAVYFQAVLSGRSQSLINYQFVECQNNRKKCETNIACGNNACPIE